MKLAPMIIPWISTLTMLLLSGRVTSRKSPHEVPRGSLNAGKCRFIINEINIFPSGSLQFVELKRACSTKPERITDTSMVNYKIAFITHDAYLVATCNLGEKGAEYASKREGDVLFYVIGGPMVNNADMQIKSCEFASDYNGFIGDHFPVGDAAPLAIALLYNKDKKILSGITLDKSSNNLSLRKVFIRYSMELVLMKNIQDMYIITSSSPFTSCKYFENYVASYSLNTRHFLRDWGQYEADVQKSLSRCKVSTLEESAKDWEPFQPAFFNLAKSTPGEPNLCSSSVHFEIEDLQPRRKRARLDFDTKYQCEISTEDEAIESLQMITSPMNYQDKLRAAITEQLWNQLYPVQPMEIEEVPTAPRPHSTPYQDFFKSENDNEQSSSCVPNPSPLSKENFEKYLQDSSPFIWKDCSGFEPKELLEAVRSDPKASPLRETDIMSSDTCYWFEWIGDLKKFRCKLCNRLWNQGIIFDSKKHITKMITFGLGYMKANAKYDNKKAIEKHRTSPLHNLAVEYHRLYDEGLRGDVLRRKFTEPDGMYRKFLRKTENRFISVFQSIRLDIPFFKYPLLSELLEYFEIDMGKRFNNPDGNKEILMSISSKIHADLADFFKVKKPEMSILVDTSSDVQSTYSMTILFQTYNQDDDIVVVVYRVLLVDQRETSENLYRLLMDSLTEDGLLDWVKEKCVGFSTDGGANVKKLSEMLNHVTDHELIYNYCHSHRLDRAVAAAWGKDNLLKEVESVVNEVQRSFNCRSPRKKLLMMQKIRENADSTFELKEIKKIRYVNSKRRATRTVIRHWKTILSAIQAVQVDKTFPKKQRDAMKKLEAKFKDPAIIIGLAFLADATEELSKVSLNLQTHGTTLIGKKTEREEMKKGIISLKSQPGLELSRILGKAVPPQQTRPATGIEVFDLAEVNLDVVKLFKSKYTGSSTIQAITNGYIDGLVRQIDSYFPTSPSDSLDVFDQRAWPATGLDSFGDDGMRRANLGFKWNFQESKLLEEWKKLKLTIAMDADYAEVKTMVPEEFWCHYLKKDVGWSDALRIIIKNVLTVLAGTAHVERVYSHYTAIKTIRRYNLKVETVEAIIRVKLNGPDTVKEFAEQADEYVKYFIMKGYSRSDDAPKDDPTGGGSSCPATALTTAGAQGAALTVPDPTTDDLGDDYDYEYETENSEESTDDELDSKDEESEEEDDGT